MKYIYKIVRKQLSPSKICFSRLISKTNKNVKKRENMQQ